ncbi:DNA ligase D-like protein (predicted polymerase) [Lentzea atacamensis]|uniref:DNA ligase D-like protein (Predicted polymerase) n=2 Tax=Lentzea TaxID=165301 RepID=A0A316I3U5_9PSEU|nr:ATP-dependent DNA ligase [Lentzea atacamensis]PWK85113.1 DNA ligase D-like protein (predicted polymerase) [Lentzea atacamensis]RAS66112.1 DNA ligase D-like protein (predicted polymerase) [Lentzea atacamensis]
MSSDQVKFSSLDQPLFGGTVKGDLVEYLDFVADRFVPVLAGRPLSVWRILRGQEPFMQKNVPKYTPSFVKTVDVWAETSHRQIKYALCDDKQTLMWFANQRAVEYHVPLFLKDHFGDDHQTHMVLDIDPPEGAGFDVVAGSAFLIREALAQAGLQGAVKTSGAKGVHIFVPLEKHDPDDVAAATRAVAARAEKLDPSLATTAYIRADRDGKVFLDSTRAWGATVVAAYSPRLREGLPISFPVPWDSLADVTPADFTVRTRFDGDPWSELMPEPQRLPDDLVTEGHGIPVARVVAMHEGKRRKAQREREK